MANGMEDEQETKGRNTKRTGRRKAGEIRECQRTVSRERCCKARQRNYLKRGKGEIDEAIKER